MSYPEKNAGYRSNGKSVMRMASERAEGGSVEERYMAPPNMKPTDPTVTADEVKTWGSPDNARAAARARENAKPMTADDEARMGREMAGPFGRSNESAKGLGRSIGFKRGGAVKRKRRQGGPVDLAGGPYYGGDTLEDAKANAGAAKQDLDDAVRSYKGPEKHFYDTGLHPPGNQAARNLKRASGGRLPEPLVDNRGRTLAQLAGDEPDGAPLSLKTPSSPGAAQDAREQAARRTRNTRAMPNSFKVGGNE